MGPQLRIDFCISPGQLLECHWCSPPSQPSPRSISARQSGRMGQSKEVPLLGNLSLSVSFELWGRTSSSPGRTEPCPSPTLGTPHSQTQSLPLERQVSKPEHTAGGSGGCADGGDHKRREEHRGPRPSRGWCCGASRSKQIPHHHMSSPALPPASVTLMGIIIPIMVSTANSYRF